MNQLLRKLRLVEVGVFFCIFPCLATTAQIVPDATLATNSLVTHRGNNIVIEGGTIKGGNLFHSFDQFSVSTGGSAYFNNAINIQNIISRVTGGSISNIDGILRANGTANFFLINPNGIIFGSNARLNIGGSFLGTTASSINFADGSQFSATTPQATPLLTISVPIGLGFGSNPGGIRVQGAGHDLIGLGYSPVIGAGGSLTGLRVQPGKTLALVGGDIALKGGTLTAPSGRIELGSVDKGLVTLNPTNSGWTLGYKSVPSFKDIGLSFRALVDTSGVGTGSTQIQGRRLLLTTGSVILSQNQGLIPAGTLSVNATESLEVSGTDPVARILSGFWNETLGFGNGGDITISAPKLLLQSGGTITTRTHGAARAGNITVNAPEFLKVIGASPLTSRALSNITSLTLSSGHAGDIKVLTGQLTATGGGVLISTTAGTGAGGDLTVNASDFVELIGVEPRILAPSSISASTLYSGTAGRLRINTSKLVIKDGGRVDSSTGASGSGGSVTINASDSVELSGAVPRSRNPSLVISSANILDETLVGAYGTLPVLTGASGDVTINTGRLSVTNGAQVTVRNDGTGSAGNLQINANSINLDNHGGITASTISGAGGNILLNIANQLNLDQNSLITATSGGQGRGGNITIDPQQTSISNGSGITVSSTGTGNAGQLKISSNNLTLNNGGFLSANTNGGEGGSIFLNAQNLQLRHSSLFTAAASGSGNGGNISINTGTLAILENSNISANATKRQGGNIRINAQGLFQSLDSPITASGGTPELNGTVQVNTLVNNATLAIVPLPIVPVDAAKLIAQGCGGNAGARGNKFVVIGSGGLPPGPNEPQTGNTVWTDLGSDAAPKSVSSDSSDIENAMPSTEYEYKGGPLVEAQGWVTNSKGEVVLTANAPTLTPDIPWVKPASCRAH